MIYAVGVDGDYTFHEFLRECSRRRVNVQPVNLRALVLRGNWVIDVTKPDGCHLEFDEKKVVMNPDKGVFFRPFLPSLSDVKRAFFVRWENLIQGLSTWFLYHRVNVINSPRSSDFNSLKSLHEHLLSQCGFSVPRSITSSDSSRLENFLKRYTSVIKSHCGVRANARIIGPKEVKDYDSRRGPLHLQEYIPGSDVRSHVVGDSVFSTMISSSAVDYRSDAKGSVYSLFDLGGISNEKLVSTTRHFGLALAGWDFKIDSRGKLWTLEMNSMPGYAGYDKIHRGNTTAGILDLLVLKTRGISI